MNDIMRPIYWLGLIIGGGCGSYLWYMMFVPAKNSESQQAKLQAMVRHDGSWKFILYTSFIMAAGIFLFSFVSLLATFC